MMLNAQPGKSIFDSRPIGIFDSGVGGISIAKCIQQQLPHEHLIYTADSRHAPYGEKTRDFIQQRVNAIATMLVAQQAKALVLACNTATVNAIDQLRERLTIPIIGVEPAIKPAVMHSKSKKIALLVTQATATNPRFLALVARFSQGAQVIIQPCPGLVELIEQGQRQSQQCIALLKRYVCPLIDQGVDTLVLGCTHYPFLTNSISKLVGPQITIVETATAVAQQLQRQLQQQQVIACPSQTGRVRIICSERTPAAQALFSDLWQKPLIFEGWQSPCSTQTLM